MNEYRITGLELNGVGVFDQLKLTFPEKPKTLKDRAEIHIFTGANGTGKTTLLQALTYFDVNGNDYIMNNYPYGTNSDLFAKNNRQSDLKTGITHPHFNLHFEHSTYKSNTAGSGSIILTQPIHRYYEEFVNVHIIKSQPPYAFFGYSGNRQTARSTETKAMKELKNNPLHEALNLNRKEISSDLFQWILNCRTRSAVAYQNGELKLSAYYVELLEKLEKSVAAITGRREVKFIIDQQSLFFKVQLDGSSDSIAFEQLAEGYKSIISWLADLMYRLDAIVFTPDSPFALFLDEIDVHLHPAAQRRILPVIQKLFPNAQIFLTTHSPFVLGSVDGAWIYKFKFDEKGNSVLDGDGPVLSEDGMSYTYIVKEILGVPEDFGPDVVDLLDKFKIEKQKLLKGETEDTETILKLSKDLSHQSIELQSIIGSELRQLSRITKKEYSI